MSNGTVKFFNNVKGFGFINPEEGGKDIFFHANDLADGRIDDLNEGDVVTFESAESEKGPKAVNVAVA